jgi:FkbM family methyltransferase
MILETAKISAFTQKVTPRNPFKAEELPLLARLYRYPLDKWSSRGRQLLFGAPWFLAYSVLQRFPFPSRGSVRLSLDSKEKILPFNGKNTQFQAIYCKAFRHGYEPEVEALLDIVVPQKGVFWDVGSNWGYFALYVASKAGHAGRIRAFEPYPATFLDLKETVAASGLDIECNNVAVGAREGYLGMKIPDHLHSGLAMISRDSNGGTKVKVVPLDSMGQSAPDVIKIDVEGFEEEVLLGGTNLLQTARPLIVMENWRNVKDPGWTLRPLQILERAGYQLFQPLWVREFEGERVLSTAFVAGETCALALLPFSWKVRFALEEQVNVFACPSEKIDSGFFGFQREVFA